MTLRLDPGAFDTRATRLAERAAALAERRDAVAAEVAGLLADWRGTAADSFTAGWERWREAADDVVLALEARVAALDRTGADLSATDAVGAEDHQRLARRLG